MTKATYKGSDATPIPRPVCESTVLANRLDVSNITLKAENQGVRKM